MLLTPQQIRQALKDGKLVYFSTPYWQNEMLPIVQVQKHPGGRGCTQLKVIRRNAPTWVPLASGECEIP
jgi:hypothetical protein